MTRTMQAAGHPELCLSPRPFTLSTERGHRRFRGKIASIPEILLDTCRYLWYYVRADDLSGGRTRV